MEQAGILADWTAPPTPGPDVIEGRFMRLERLDAVRHADELFAANGDDVAMWEHLRQGPFANLAEYEQWVARVAASPDAAYYAIRDLARGQAVGVAAYLNIVPDHGRIEIGDLAFSPLLQRRPAASEALMAMIGWAFDAGYRRVEWKCNMLNLPSRSAAERLGFTFEGVFRQHMIVKGRSRDTAWFSIIDADYPALRERYHGWLSPANFDAGGQQIVSLRAMIGRHP